MTRLVLVPKLPQHIVTGLAAIRRVVRGVVPAATANRRRGCPRPTRTTRPAMYEDDTHTGVRLSEESVRLWKRHVREYVQEMQA